MRFRTPTSDAAADSQQQQQRPAPHHRRASTTATPSASEFTTSSSSGLGPPRTRPAQRSHSTSRVRPNTFSSSASSSATGGGTAPPPPSSSSYSRPTARVPPSSRAAQPTPNSTQPNSFPSKDFSNAASTKAQNEEFNQRTAAAASSAFSSSPRSAADGAPTSPRGRSVPSYQQPTVSSVRRGRATTTAEGGTPVSAMGTPRATATQSSENAMPSPSRHHQGRGLNTMQFPPHKAEAISTFN